MIIALPEDDPRYSEKIRDLNKVRWPAIPALPATILSVPAPNRLSVPGLGATSDVQARNLLLMASPFKSLEALLSLLDDFGEGTGVMHVRAQRQPIRGNLVPAVVNGIRDIRDEETQTTLRAYLGQTYLFHKAFKCVLDITPSHGHLLLKRQLLLSVWSRSRKERIHVSKHNVLHAVCRCLWSHKDECSALHVHASTQLGPSNGWCGDRKCRDCNNRMPNYYQASPHLCRPLLQARVEEQTRQQRVLNPECPAPELLEPQIKLFVEGSEVNFEDHPFVKALKESGCLEKDIEVKEIISEDAEGRDIVLGWCTFTYQASTDQASCRS